MEFDEIIDHIIPDRTGEEPIFQNYLGVSSAPHIVYKAYLIEDNKLDVDVARVYHDYDIIMDIPDELLTKRPNRKTKKI